MNDDATPAKVRLTDGLGAYPRSAPDKGLMMESRTINNRRPQGVGIVSWPEGVSAATGISSQTLQRGRSQGDAPQLYAVSERALVTTDTDLLAWIRAKAVPAGYKCRPATIQRGTKRPARSKQAEST